MDYQFEKLTDQEKLDFATYIANQNLSDLNLKLDNIVFKETIYTKYIKRILDVLISFPAVIVTLPINVFLAIATFFDVGRPLIFYQERTGKELKNFNFGKFRNMRDERDENGILLLAKDRVTDWGRFVRKTSLDELLNFWYILKGDMSVIGPRPLPSEYTERFNKRDINRYKVRPGLECPLHKKEYRGGMTWQNRFDNDVWYVEHISFITDVKLFAFLIYDAIYGRKHDYRANAEIGTFMGYEKDGTVIDSNDIPVEYYIGFMKTKGL